MHIRFITVLLAIAAIIASSCTFVEKKPSSDSIPSAVSGPGPDMPSAPESLPFRLFIGDIQVGPDLTVSVPENQGMIIQYESETALTCGLSLLGADREAAVTVGSWTGEMAQYFQEFPYGENHLFLTRDERIWDILVVAGPPQQESTDSGGCNNSFLDLNTDARWTYETYQSGESSGQLINRVENIRHLQDGTTSLTLVMERIPNGEGKIEGTIEAELICDGEIILVSQVSEHGMGTARMTDYNDGTVYMPSILAGDIWWERRGSLIVEEGHDSVFYEVVEQYQCTGRENISIPLGEFEAYRVEYTIEQTSWTDTISFSGVSWYVEGLGRVLNEADIFGSPRVELVSYENISPKQ